MPSREHALFLLDLDMKYIDADRLKAEIDKRYAEYREKMKSDDFTYYEGKADALDLFEQFIDSLESEKPMNLEELEKEAVNYCFDNGLNISPRVATDFARHFAQWGAEHRDSSETPNDLEEAAKAYALDTAEDSEQYSARYLGYKDGAKWQKEQDDKELSEKIAAAYQLGVKDKEQMMKEARK